MCQWSSGLIIEDNRGKWMNSDLKGHGFSRAEDFTGFSPCGNSLYPTYHSPQRLKPSATEIMTARLKACPFKSATQGSE
jgi:hypothetical protein